MTRPAWLETVAGICGGEAEEWATSDNMTWRSPVDDSRGIWLADHDSVTYRGDVRIGVWRVAGEHDHARLANAVQAARAVERGDLDVDALQQQVATLTRERDELAARPAEPVGPLVPDAAGWWWLDMGGQVAPVRVQMEDVLGSLVYSDVFGRWLVSSADAARWRGPVAPPRGAR